MEEELDDLFFFPSSLLWIVAVVVGVFQALISRGLFFFAKPRVDSSLR